MRSGATSKRNVYAFFEELQEHFRDVPSALAAGLEKVTPADLESQRFLTENDIGRVKWSVANWIHLHGPLVIVDEAQILYAYSGYPLASERIANRRGSLLRSAPVLCRRFRFGLQFLNNILVQSASKVGHHISNTFGSLGCHNEGYVSQAPHPVIPFIQGLLRRL